MGTPNETTVVRRTRTSDLTRHELSEQPRGNKTVCLPIGQERYTEVFENPVAFRALVDEMYQSHPDLFPKAMGEGYILHDLLDPSRKLPDVRLRRFKLKANQAVYTIRPSYVLPYMTGYTDDVEKGRFNGISCGDIRKGIDVNWGAIGQQGE